jgi:hypothetical protein
LALPSDEAIAGGLIGRMVGVVIVDRLTYPYTEAVTALPAPQRREAVSRLRILRNAIPGLDAMMREEAAWMQLMIHAPDLSQTRLAELRQRPRLIAEYGRRNPNPRAKRIVYSIAWPLTRASYSQLIRVVALPAPERDITLEVLASNSPRCPALFLKGEELAEGCAGARAISLIGRAKVAGRVVGQGGVEPGEQVVGPEEADAIAGLASADSQRDGEVRFPHAARSDPEDRLLLVEECELGELEHLAAVEAGLLLEVEVFEAADLGELGLGDAQAGGPVVAGEHLRLGNAGDEPKPGELERCGLLQVLIEVSGRVRQPQALQVGDELVHLLAGHGRPPRDLLDRVRK